jgi:hypothetical protein
MEGSSSDLSNGAEGHRARTNSYEYNTEEGSLGSDSSDDESSYFAKHLPSPKVEGAFHTLIPRPSDPRLHVLDHMHHEVLTEALGAMPVSLSRMTMTMITFVQR